MKPIQKIGVFAPRCTVACQLLLDRLYRFCQSHSIDCYVIQKAKLPEHIQLEEGTDLALCLGGDGAILSLVRQAAFGDVLLAGVNLGHLGFLSSCSKDQFDSLLECIAEARYDIDERTLLKIKQLNSEDEVIAGPFYALNEVSLMRVQTGKMIDVDVALDGHRFNRYHADGILVATPTGSSAYSLSAGGPLIWPHSQVLCLTPICPHSLTNRAVVMPDTVEITLRPRARRGRVQDQLIFSLDGRTTRPIALRERLQIRKSTYSVKLIYLPKSDYATRLRSKLGW